MNSNSGETSLIPRAVRGLCVLVVDHDTTSLMYIASVLEKLLYKVRTTELASVALSMIEKEVCQFDIVMADVEMPEMDIFTFLNTILLKRDMPIIFMSHGANMDMAKKALAEGACFFLEKPIRKQDLINLWQHVYRKRSCRTKIQNEDNATRVATENDPIDLRGRNKQFQGHVSLVEAMGEQGQCNGIDQAKAKEKYYFGAKIGEVANFRRIEGLDGVSRHGCDDFGGVGNENLSIDTSENDERIEGEEEGEQVEGSSMIEAQEIGMRRMVDKGKGKQVELKRRRVIDDENGKRSEELKRELKGSDSKGKETISGGEERKGKDSSNTTEKKSRMHWTPELHRKFTEAISVLGEEKAHPKAVLEMMNVPNMTQRHVASHLQKYRDRVKRISDACAAILPSVLSKTTSSSYKFYSGNGFPQTQEQHNPMKISQGLVILNSGTGANTTNFTPSLPPANPNLHIGSSLALNYANLSPNFSQNTHPYQDSNFNKGPVLSSEALPKSSQIRRFGTMVESVNLCASEKGKQPLVADVYADNYSNVIPTLASPLNIAHTYQYTKAALPNVQNPLDSSRGINAPNSLQRTNQSSFPTDVHYASQVGLATPSRKLNLTDYNGLMKEFEVLNAQLNADDFDSFLNS